jgi:hypothetical protein
MTGIDDRLERDLERAARPAAPDPGATFRDVTRRRARHATVRKVQTVALVAVVLLGTIGGFAVLQRNFTGAQQPETGGSTSTPSPSTATPAFAPIDIPSDPTKTFMVDGLSSFPVCGVSMIEGDFLGTGATYAYVYRKASDAGCDTDTWVVAVQVPKDAAGTSSTFVEGGPLDCQDPSACFVYANPDINGDGQDEIAIVSAQGASTTSFELYEAKQTGSDWGLNPYIGDDGMPLRFDEGGSATHQAGTYCDDSSGSRRFVSWGATSSDGTTFDVTETRHVVSESLTASSPSRFTASADSLPPNALDGCGGTIQNSSTP